VALTLSVSKFFSYIAGVFDPSDKALLLNIFADFHQNLNWPIGFFRAMREIDLWKKTKAENLM
jgi:hypothetical protein